MTIEGNVATNQGAQYNVFHPDAGSRFITLRHNVAATDFSSFGGCGPYGDLLFEHNYWQTPGRSPWDCRSTGPGDQPTNVVFRDNATIGGVDEAPAKIVNSAGPRGD